MENLEKAILAIKEALPGLKLLENEPMSGHCSFRIGGPVRALAVPSDVMSLTKICHFLKENHVAPMLLGNGTNILFPDEGLKDLFIISTEKLTNMFLLPDGSIYAEAGVSLAKLASFAHQNSLTGLEFASGIPGSVGGGVLMNAGAYGGELKDVIQSVVYYTCPSRCFMRYPTKTALLPTAAAFSRSWAAVPYSARYSSWKRANRMPSPLKCGSSMSAAGKSSLLTCLPQAAPLSARRVISPPLSSSRPV